MDAAGWSAVAAIGSTIAAGVSLVVAGQARRIQGIAADFSNCLEAARELRDAMRRVTPALFGAPRVRKCSLRGGGAGVGVAACSPGGTDVLPGGSLLCERPS
jgi:hypothetical protein